MSKQNLILLRSALVVGALLATEELLAQSLRVTAANSSAPNAVYDVLFSPAGTTLLNSNGSAIRSFRALAFVPGATGGADLVVADSGAGSIVRYVGPTGTPTESSVLVWSAASNVPGPQHPDGLSVDAAGLRCGYCGRRLRQPGGSSRRYCSTRTSPATRWTHWSTR